LTITSVIFDFDGVLADTERLHLRATQDALAQYGWTLDDQTYFARYLGFGDRDLVVELARDSGRTIDRTKLDAIVAAKALRYRHYLAAGDALYSTAAACVTRLRGRFSLAIASGSLRTEIHDILIAGGLRDAFRVIVGADDVANGKPSAEPYLTAAAQLNVEPTSAVAIEDSRWGLESAHAAGMHTIGITTSYPASALAMADLIVGSLDELSVAAIERFAMR
jgi:beta-phosphoglucomutase